VFAYREDRERIGAAGFRTRAALTPRKV
jgi:hypothetical protein